MLSFIMIARCISILKMGGKSLDVPCDQTTSNTVKLVKTYHNGFPQKILKTLLETRHVISVALDRHSSLQNWEIITSQRNILIVSPAPLVCVDQIIISVYFFNNPLRQWNTAQLQST